MLKYDKKLCLDEDSDEDIKEIFTCFGLCMYYAQILEMALASFLTNAYGTPPPLRHVWGFDFDLQAHEKSTLGQLITYFREQDPSHQLLPPLNNALKDRNWIVHAFFKDNAVAFCKNDQRKKMKTVLNKITKEFNELQNTIGQHQLK